MLHGAHRLIVQKSAVLEAQGKKVPNQLSSASVLAKGTRTGSLAVQKEIMAPLGRACCIGISTPQAREILDRHLENHLALRWKVSLGCRIPPNHFFVLTSYQGPNCEMWRKASRKSCHHDHRSTAHVNPVSIVAWHQFPALRTALLEAEAFPEKATTSHGQRLHGHW